MSAKAGTAQPPGRRTPLSLNASVKQTKPIDKNDNTKKEPITNQKTENLKKDSQLERKLSTDKKQSSSESKKSSSTADTKKPEEVKNAKTEDNKKSQNGVNGNNVKDKQNDGGAKVKPETSANGSASKKEAQKSTDKKESNDTKDNKKEIKNEDNKKKTVEKQTEEKSKSADKTKDVPDASVQKLEQDSTNKKKDDVKIVDKPVEEKNTSIASPGKAAQKDQTMEIEVALDSSKNASVPASPLKAKQTDVQDSKTPVKETKPEEIKKPIENDPIASEDVEMMEPLICDEEPIPKMVFAVSTPTKNISPKETKNLFEEPTKFSPKSEIKPPREPPATYTPDRKSCPRTFSSISGRRSIRPIGDYTFSGNLQIRESYRKINTELDFTSSSLNVTVGSEVPNSDSFSFFSRSRKRDRSSPTVQSGMELQADLSPKSPKRAKVESGMSTLLYAMASPITMLRARLSRATVNSTPKKLIVDKIEQDIVENVSAIAVESVDEDLTAVEETFNPDSTVADAAVDQCDAPPKPTLISEVDEDIKIKETFTAPESQTKKKCNIM